MFSLRGTVSEDKMSGLIWKKTVDTLTLFLIKVFQKKIYIYTYPIRKHLNLYMQLSSGASGLFFLDLSHYLPPYFECASTEASDKTALMHMLV